MSNFGGDGSDVCFEPDDLDDALLVSRIRSVMMGDTHRDLEGETIEEQPELVLGTVLRQIRNGSPSREALGYVAHCLDRYLGGEVTSLDDAFYAKHKRPPGGQAIFAEVDRATVRAFMSVIRRDTWKFDTALGGPVYSIPSKSVLREAYHAAYVAYRKAVGKARVEDNDPERKINQTIKPILRRMGVFR